jgi:hypothetical protein
VRSARQQPAMRPTPSFLGSILDANPRMRRGGSRRSPPGSLDGREYAVDVMSRGPCGLRQHSSAPEKWSRGGRTQTKRRKGKEESEEDR